MNLRPVFITMATGLVCLAGAVESRAVDASCLLRIQFDSDELPLGYPAIDALVGSSGIVGSAAREIDAIVAASREQVTPISHFVIASFEETPQRGKPAEDVLLGQLTVHVEEAYVDGAQEHARTILTLVCRRLREVLVETSEQDHQRLKDQLAQAQHELAQAMQQRAALRELGQELCREAGLLKLERDEILHEAKVWNMRVRDLNMELVAANARQQALATRIAELSGQVEDIDDDDPILKELQELVGLREHQLEYLVERLGPGGDETLEAQERLIDARIQLAQTRRQMAETRGGELLVELTHELSETTVELAELKVKVQETERAAERYLDPKVLALAERYQDEVDTPLTHSAIRVRSALSHQQELEHALMAYQPPTITILGGLEAE